MLRHAVCDKDGNVVNVVLWDGISKWSPRDITHYVVRHDECSVGDKIEKESNKITKYHDRTDRVLDTLEVL